MELFLVFGLVTGLIIYGMASSVTNTKEAWSSAAEEADLVYKKTLPNGKKLEGRRRGFDIDIDEVSENKQTTIRARISGVYPGFTLGRDSALQRLIKPDIETGDQLFDERTRIEGDADWALALLGDEARRLTEMVISGWQGELKHGVLSASYQDIRHTPSNLGIMLDLAHLLRRPDDHELPKLLMERACHDASKPVRLQALRRLAASSAFRQEALATAEELLDSSSDVLRLEASRLLVKSRLNRNERAADELAALATGLSNDSSVRRSALDTLVEESRYRETAISALRTILEQLDTPSAVRTAALDGLISVRAKSELLDIQTDGDMEAEILAKGLGRFDVAVQPRLIQLLEESGDRIRIAAAKSLGQVGDLDAIGALREVTGQDRLWKSALARAAEHAIASIKSRSGGSQQGEISIIHVAPLEGAVSPSDDSEAGGEVSLTS